MAVKQAVVLNNKAELIGLSSPNWQKIVSKVSGSQDPGGKIEVRQCQQQLCHFYTVFFRGLSFQEGTL